MTDIRRLGQLILARIVAEVPELGGRVYDKAFEGVAFPYATLGPIYGSEADAECIEADEWVVQIDLWDQASNKLKMAELAQKVRCALKGWSDTSEVTMHPLSVQTPRIMDDPDPGIVHGVVQVEAEMEG